MRDTLAYRRDLICSVDRRRLSTANRLVELRSWILVEERMQFNKLSDIWNDLGERSTAVMNLYMNMYWKNVGLLQRRNGVKKMIDGWLTIKGQQEEQVRKMKKKMNEWTKERKNESLRPRESNSDRITFHIAESATRMQKLSLFSESRKKKQ